MTATTQPRAASGGIEERARLLAELFFPDDMVWQKRAYQRVVAALHAERDACARIALKYVSYACNEEEKAESDEGKARYWAGAARAAHEVAAAIRKEPT